MLKSLVFGLVGLLASATASAVPVTRDIGIELYVYGTDIDGLALQATKNGTILVSETSSSSLYDVVLTTANLLSPWTATLSNNGSILSGFDLYINASPDAFDPIGFVPSNLTTTIPDIVTTGFLLYGTNLEYFDGATLLSKFWASPVSGTNGTYEIFWNSADISDDSIVPVTIKTLAPIDVVA